MAVVGSMMMTFSAGAQDVPTVRYGIYEPGLDSGFLLMAKEKQFWQEQGVNVEVVTFKSASQVFPAFIAGEVDVIQANPSEALLVAARGADIKFIGSTMPGLNYALLTT
jgi:ABC-type nitrate/sulfonate/bicarbonate transport system substrate-binding protein